VCAAPNVPELIRLTQGLLNMAEKAMVMISAMETRRNKVNKKKCNRMSQYVFTGIFILLDREFHSEKCYWRIVRSCMSLFVDKLIYSGRNTEFSEIDKFRYNKCDSCQINTELRFAKGLSHNQTERQQIDSNLYAYNY